MDSSFLENVVFLFHEISTALLSVHAIYAVSVSGNVLNNNLQDRQIIVHQVFIRMYTHTPLPARSYTSTLS